MRKSTCHNLFMAIAEEMGITLQNTADGSRYELELLAVEGFPLPKKG